MAIRSKLAITTQIVSVAMLPACVSGCTDGILHPAGPISAAERVILLDAIAIMLAIVVPTIVCTLVFAWWFRNSNPRAQYRPQWQYSGRLELLVWSIPALVVVFLGGIGWTGSHQLDPAVALPGADPALEVEAIALDWKWLFIYPGEGIASVNEIVAPVGRKIHFRITSASVMNVFFIPRLGSQIYAMNGMTTSLNLRADERGNYRGLAAHFNGDGFSDMHFNFKAVTLQEFTGWTETVRGSGPFLDRDAYVRLTQQTQNVDPHTYRSVTPNLFDAIVSRRLAPGPGPQPPPQPPAPLHSGLTGSTSSLSAVATDIGG